MAARVHACEKAGKPKCAWCKEADANQYGEHTCSSYGTCS